MSEVDLEFRPVSGRKPENLSIVFNLGKESKKNKKLLRAFIANAENGGIRGFAYSTPDKEVLGIEINVCPTRKRR